MDIKNIAFIFFFVGAVLFVINASGGSGYDVGVYWDWLRNMFTGRHGAETTSTPKILPRFRHAALIGFVILTISLVVFLVTK